MMKHPLFLLLSKLLPRLCLSRNTIVSVTCVSVDFDERGMPLVIQQMAQPVDGHVNHKESEAAETTEPTVNRDSRRKSLFMKCLPDNILSGILENLPFKERIKFSRLNRRFGSVSDDVLKQTTSFSYRSFSYHRVNSGDEEGHLMEGRLKVLSKMNLLKSFEVPDVVEFRLPVQLAEYCPLIEEMRCRSLQLVYDYALALNKKGQKVHLKMINLTTTDVLDAELLIRILLLSPSIDVSTSSVSLIPTLTKFENYFRNSPANTALIHERVTRLIISSILHVRGLNLSSFSRLTALEMLTNVDKDIITSALSRLHHLKELTIKTEIENFDLLSQFPMELEKLHFTDTLTSTPADSRAFWFFLENRCKKLQELTIMCKKMRGIPDGDFLEMLRQNCPKLHSIHVHNFQYLRVEYCSVTRKLLIARYNQRTLTRLFWLFPQMQYFEIEGDVNNLNDGWIKQMQEFANVRRSREFKGILRFYLGQTISRDQDGVNLDITVYS